MSFLKDIRQKAGNHFLKREFSRRVRDVRVANLEIANSVGILFQATDEKSCRLVKDYVKNLKNEGIRKIKALGYVDDAHVPAYLHPTLEFDYFTRKQLNWYGKPSGNEVTNFISQGFDILIDLSVTDCFPLKFILGLSTSGFKVGKYSEENEELYDMMLQIGQVKSLSYLISQIDHYLNIINKPEQNAQQI